MACSCSSCSSSSCCASTTCGSCQCSECTSCTAVCTALEVSNSWNVPACSASAVLAIPGLTTLLIGSYIYSPTYGYFRISAFDSVNGQVTVVNECWPGNAAPGTVVPALTTFIFSGPPVIESADGWIAAGETWTYASTTSITVPTDAREKYAVGDKILLYQAGIPKYFSVIDVAPTVLTIVGGDDYILSNVAITEPQYSHTESPVGFPAYFNFTPVYTGFSVAPGTGVNYYRVGPGYCTVKVNPSSNGTSNATTLTIQSPLTAKTVVGASWSIPWSSAIDNGAAVAAAGRVSIASGSNTIVACLTMAPASSSSWTNANAKAVYFNDLVFPI